MILPISFIRAWRTIKRTPPQAFRDWHGVIFDRSEFFSLCLAILTSWIGLQTASLPKVLEEAQSWVNAVQAFVYVALGWALICLIRAPFVVLKKERELGRWHGNRFIYHRPLLVATLRCRATGEPQFHKVIFDDAEPSSFVYYELEAEGNPPQHLFSAMLAGDFILGEYRDIGRGLQRTGGLRIGKDKSAELMITMREDMASQTIRVYARNFLIGELDDQDGDEGELREAIRRPVASDGKG